MKTFRMKHAALFARAVADASRRCRWRAVAVRRWPISRTTGRWTNRNSSPTSDPLGRWKAVSFTATSTSTEIRSPPA